MADTKKDARSAIFDALALVGRTLPPADGASDAPAMAAATLPTAKAREAVDTLLIAGSPEGADRLGIQLKPLLAAVLDWDGPKYTRATKAVTRTLGAILTGTDANGRSTYAQAVEMTSFLALAAPLLQPDRLARIAQEAATTSGAYRPVKYLLGPSGQLRTVLSGYEEAKREQLLIDLWHAVHDGRWWDHTTGDGFVRDDGHRYTGRKRRQVQVTPEQRTVLTEQVQNLLNAGGIPTAELMADAIEARTLTWSIDAERLMARIPEPDVAGRRRLLEALASTDDEDHRILAAQIPWLPIEHRPESPAGLMISVLLTALGGPAEFNFDEHMPAHPDEWAELYPEASREPFPVPREVRDLHGRNVPGLAGTTILVMHNPDLLKRNANHMGNCTFSYAGRCQQGTHVILRFDYAGMDYNVSLYANGGRTGVGEINSRFNRGNVPAEVTTAVANLAAALPWPAA